MNEKNDIIYVCEGVLRGFFLTLVLIVIYTVITYFTKTNDKTASAFYVIITALGVMYGAIYAVRKIKRRGWLNGMLVGVFYMLVIFIISLLSGRGASISSYAILRFVLAIFVGTLSGMLGINI